jgi:hypothetical protein
MAKDLDWDELYKYVKEDILNYKDKKMPKDMILRLVGLKDGKFCANNNSKIEAKYDYKLILLTFKLMKGTISNCLNSVEFKDEKHKINYIMKIIESEINNVKDRLDAKKRSEEKLLETDFLHQIHEQSNYTKKSSENKRLKNLW